MFAPASIARLVSVSEYSGPVSSFPNLFSPKPPCMHCNSIPPDLSDLSRIKTDLDGSLFDAARPDASPAGPAPTIRMSTYKFSNMLSMFLFFVKIIGAVCWIGVGSYLVTLSHCWHFYCSMWPILPMLIPVSPPLFVTISRSSDRRSASISATRVEQNPP